MTEHIVTNSEGAEFVVPSFCAHCGEKMTYIFDPPKGMDSISSKRPVGVDDFDWWWSFDGTMLMVECGQCHTHFGVAGVF